MAFNKPESVTLDCPESPLPALTAPALPSSLPSEILPRSLFTGITQSLLQSAFPNAAESKSDHSHVFDQDQRSRRTGSKSLLQFAVVHPICQYGHLEQRPGLTPERLG